MTLETYFKIRKIQDRIDLGAREKSLAIIGIVENIDPRKLRDMPFSEVEAIKDRVNSQLEYPPVEVKDKYEVGGVRYKLMRTLNSMTAIQFSDLMTTIKQGDIEKHLPTILSLLLVPYDKDGEPCRYPDYDRFKVEENLFANFEIADAFAISDFCQALSYASHHNILTSLILNEATVWARIPKWRRSLLRKILKMLLMPQGENLLAKNGDS